MLQLGKRNTNGGDMDGIASYQQQVVISTKAHGDNSSC
jgi:hypothetical protein